MQHIHNQNKIAQEQWSKRYELKELDIIIILLLLLYIIIHLLILGITFKATSSPDEVLSNKQARYVT